MGDIVGVLLEIDEAVGCILDGVDAACGVLKFVQLDPVC